MQEQSIDCYNILQVHHDAEKDVIDAAYRCLSKMYHPDLNRSPAAAEHMKNINIAYNIIGDESTRRDYHRDWMRKNAWRTLSEHDTVGRFVAESRETYSAQETLDAFFLETLNEKWESAYARLTTEDREQVAFQDFLEWKQAVHAVYRLGNYHINYFRRYSDCKYGGRTYPKIFHFIVRVTELQLVTGQIIESSSHKYVAVERGLLRVCLGNRDLKPSTEKFTQLARVVPKADIDEALVKAVNKIDVDTGILTRSGWIEEAEKEFLRGRRYGNNFCLGVLGFAPKLAADGTLHGEETLEKNIAYISDFLLRNIRKIDTLGRCADLALAVVFPETTPRNGKRALEKLAGLLRDDAYIRRHFPCRISATVKKPGRGGVEETLASLLDKVGVRDR